MVQHHCKCSKKPHPRVRQRRNPFIPSDESLCDPLLQWPTPPIPKLESTLRFSLNRQLGHERRNPTRVYGELLAETLPESLEEKEFKLGEVNKVFASQWLNDKQVVLGTKCNKLMVMDVMTGRLDHIPSLKSSAESVPADCPCGIHSIAVNPSRSLLATGALHTNDVAIYNLPSFQPVAVAEGAHDDWVFDMEWLDDEYLVTGSRDSRLALWQIKDHYPSSSAEGLVEHAHVAPRTVKLCQNAEKVRALVYNKNTWDVAAISLNAQLHIWDTETFTQKGSHRLRYSRENVCLALKPELNLYAVGSQSHVTFICPDIKKSLRTVYSSQPGNGIRSVSFREHILTFGTGAGSLFFYDIRACKYLECGCGADRQLDVGPGWLKHDETYRDFFSDDYYPNAIYTHCYDDSGTRLFTAGGPLPAGLWGNYAGLWQ